jgi:hypothetical protein
MEKPANQIKKGDKFQPWIIERTMKRSPKTYVATGDPQPQDGAFSHFVLIPCTNSRNKPDEVFIAEYEIVNVIE